MNKLKSITLTQIIIFLVHIFLLVWILYLLLNGGVLSFKEIALHFLGIAIYGALLIQVTAKLEMRKFKKDIKDKRR